MSDVLMSWLGREGYLPHGYCFTWSPGLLWSMVGADAVIAASYYSIPIALVHFARRRPDVQFNWLLWLFSAFIFACGTTHVLDIWTVWQPDYALLSLAKVLTAAVSIATAIALWPLMPKALKIPSVKQLQGVIDSLEAEARKRHSAEENLSDVQQSLAVTLASIGAGFIATDRAGCVVHMNKVAEHVTGWTLAQAQGHGLWEVFQREGRPADYLALNPVDLMIEQRITLDDVHHVTGIARDGSRADLEAKAALTYAPDGSVRGLAMVFRDVGRLRRAEAESSRLAAIVESSYDAIIGKTLDGHITSWNSAAERLFGYTAAEVIGHPLQILIPPELEGEENEILAKLARGEALPSFDTVRRAKDGRLIDVAVTISPIRDTEGRIIGASKIARDVSEQRRTEGALRESEARLRFTLEAAEVGDWELDLVTGANRRSPRHDRCFGYEPPIAAWSFETFLAHVHPDDRAEAQRTFAAVVDGGTDWSLQCRVIWPDGSLHWIAARARIQHENGVAVRMRGIVVDVTQQRLTEDARLKAKSLEAENRQIHEANRLKSEFLANMSHELRTPLNAIIGFADLLYAGKVPPDSPKQAVFVDHIRTSGRHLLQLINDILDLSKVESGRFEFFPEPVDLRELSGEVMNVLHSQVAMKGLQVRIEIDPAVEHLVIDAQRLKQVLYNYLSNAFKFTPQGGRVVVRALPETEHLWRLQVEDTGIGIRPEDIGRLFTEFQQLDGGLTKTHAGTGLGLALTRRLVEAQGGSVGVRSEHGAGAVFHALLPRNAPAMSGTRAPARGERESLPGAGRAVLVVEDEARDARLLADALQQAGFTVAVATTAAQALALCQERAFAAITLDLMLPDRPGLDLLAEIRASGPNREVPVLVVTVMNPPLPLAAFSVTDVLTKPVDGAAVVRALRRSGVVARDDNVVMVVDDDRQSRELMTSVLASAGYAASAYAGAEAALAALGSLRPAAVILDLAMPGLDGFEMLERLRATPMDQSLPVFVWTSRDLTSIDHERLRGKAQAVVMKSGMDMGELLSHIEACLAQR